MKLFGSLARGTTSLIAATIGAKALDFTFYLLLARTLGVAQFGRYTFALSFTLLFNVLADLGVSTVFTREVTRTPERVRALLGDALAVKIALALATLAATHAVALGTGMPARTLALVSLFTVALLFNSLAVAFENLLKSAGMPGRVGICYLFQSATGLGIGAALLLGGAGARGATLAYLAAAAAHLAAAVALSRVCWRGRSAVARRRPEAWTERWKLLRESLPLALSGVFIALYFRIDVVMLEWLKGEHSVGLYGGIYRLFEAFAPFGAAFQTVLFPVMVRAADARAGSLSILARSSLRTNFVFGIGIAVFFTVHATSIVNVILGGEYISAAGGLTLLIWALPGALMAGTLLYFLAAVGKQAMGTWAVAIAALFNIALNLLLIPRFSFLGAAAATVATEFLCFGLLFARFQRATERVGFIRIVGRPLMAAITFGALLTLTASWIPAGWLGLVGAAAVAAPIYLVLVGVLGALGTEDSRRLPELFPEAFPALDERPASQSRPGRSLANLVRIASYKTWRYLFSLGYSAWLRAIGVRVGRGCRFFGQLEIFGDPRRITIGDGCLFHRQVCLWTHDYGPGYGRIELGRGVAIARRATLNSYSLIRVGDGSGIGDGCYIQDNDHGTDPDFPFMQQPCVSAPIDIGADVWIGARCVVRKGVTIGDRAVIGAGSVVVKSIQPGDVAVGIPARPVKRRGARLETAA